MCLLNGSEAGRKTLKTSVMWFYGLIVLLFRREVISSSRRTIAWGEQGDSTNFLLLLTSSKSDFVRDVPASTVKARSAFITIIIKSIGIDLPSIKFNPS